MALKLYWRRRKECEAGHPEDFRNGEFEEVRRGWKRCACLIHASGTVAGKFKRQSTGQWEWEVAKSIAAQWESSVGWTDPPRPDTGKNSSTPTAPPATTILDAARALLKIQSARSLREQSRVS